MIDSIAIEGQHKSKGISNILLNFFWLGFAIYTVSESISTTGKVNYALLNALQVLGLLLLVPSAVFLFQPRIKNNYLRFVFIAYMVWSMITILRGFSPDYNSIKVALFSQLHGMFLFLVPFVLLIKIDFLFLKKVFAIMSILAIIFMILSLIFIKDLIFPYTNIFSQGLTESFVQNLSLPVGFLVLTYIYHSKSLNIFSLLVLALTFLISVVRARRGLIFMSFNMSLFAVIIYQYVNKTRVINKVLSVFLILSVSYILWNIYQENKKDTFGLITERIGDDTRTYVERYFYKDFKLTDWIVGRGMNGEYFCPGINEGMGHISINRTVIETGYLQTILNGGLISLILFSMIAIPAMIKGWFHSKNVLSKAAAIWIFLFYLYDYPGIPTLFSLNYILVWISIGICFSDEILNLPESETIEYFKSDKRLLQ